MNPGFESISKGIMLFGLGAFLLGMLLFLGVRTGLFDRWRGLPGDINTQIGGMQINFPLVSCIVISIVSTLILNLIGLLRK